MSDGYRLLRGQPTDSRSDHRVAIVVGLLTALLASGWLIGPRLIWSYSPAPPERYSGIVITPSLRGDCEQFEFDNKSAALRPKGAMPCIDVALPAKRSPSDV